MWTKEYRGPVVNDKYSLHKLAGIDPDGTFHTLRAASPTNRGASGQDFGALQDELGHAKSCTITRKHYISPDDRQVIDASAVYNEYLERLRSKSILEAEIVNEGTPDCESFHADIHRLSQSAICFYLQYFYATSKFDVSL